MELNDLRLINLNAGKPDINMTDAVWQQYFSIMKLITKQGKSRRMKRSHVRSSIDKYSDEPVYLGETLYSNYCSFINSVLGTIRGSSNELPQHDYCFFIYQITDLLRFEHDKLKTKWHPEYECFEVWLENE